MKSDSMRKALSATLSVLMLTLSTAVPLLDRAEVTEHTVIESGHDPATCPRGHDHTICTQVGANLSAVAARTERTPTRIAVTAAPPNEPPPSHRSVYSEGYPSRAPPSI
jgi:hypothetical protein